MLFPAAKDKLDKNQNGYYPKEKNRTQSVMAEGQRQTTAHYCQTDQGYKKKPTDPEEQISVVVVFIHRSAGTQNSRCLVVSYLAYLEHVSYQGHFEYCVPSLNFSLNRLR